MFFMIYFHNVNHYLKNIVLNLSQKKKKKKKKKERKEKKILL